MRTVVAVLFGFAIIGCIFFVGRMMSNVSGITATNFGSVSLSDDLKLAADFSAGEGASPNQPIPANTPLKPARTSPSDAREYRNEHYRVAVFYPKTWDVQELNESGGGETITFEDSKTGDGTQIFVKPDTQREVSEAVFKMDEPSGVMKEPRQIMINGVSATTFIGQNPEMGDTREIWFLHGGYVFEVVTYKELGHFLTEMMSSWEFL